MTNMTERKAKWEAERQAQVDSENRRHRQVVEKRIADAKDNIPVEMALVCLFLLMAMWYWDWAPWSVWTSIVVAVGAYMAISSEAESGR